jgi:hypothetical protein
MHRWYRFIENQNVAGRGVVSHPALIARRSEPGQRRWSNIQNLVEGISRRIT